MIIYPIPLCKLSAEYDSEKNFENRLIIGEDIDKRKVPRLYGPQ